jgi:hypothetical protein
MATPPDETVTAGDVIVVPLMLAPGALADRVAEAASEMGVRITEPIMTADRVPPELITHLVERLQDG